MAFRKDVSQIFDQYRALREIADVGIPCALLLHAGDRERKLGVAGGPFPDANTWQWGQVMMQAIGA